MLLCIFSREVNSCGCLFLARNTSSLGPRIGMFKNVRVRTGTFLKVGWKHFATVCYKYSLFMMIVELKIVPKTYQPQAYYSDPPSDEAEHFHIFKNDQLGNFERDETCTQKKSMESKNVNVNVIHHLLHQMQQNSTSLLPKAHPTLTSAVHSKH